MVRRPEISWLRWLLAGAWVCGAQLAEAQVAWRSGAISPAFADATRDAKLVLVDFYATWCGPCQTLDSVAWSRADVTQVVSQGFVPVRADADDAAGAALVRRYGVKALPTVLVLRADGTEVDRITGAALDADVLISALPVWRRGETALEVLRARGLRRPEDLAMRLEVGARYATLGNEAEARTWLERVVVIDPENRRGAAAKALLLLGERLFLTARHDAAAALAPLRTLATRWPGTEAGQKGRVALALALYLSGDERAGKQEIDAFMAEATDANRGVRGAAVAGMMLQARWDLPRAEQIARAALARVPQEHPLMDVLAELVCVEGHSTESIDLEERALALDPGNEYYAAQLQRFRAMHAQEQSQATADAGR